MKTFAAFVLFSLTSLSAQAQNTFTCQASAWCDCRNGTTSSETWSGNDSSSDRATAATNAAEEAVSKCEESGIETQQICTNHANCDCVRTGVIHCNELRQ